MAEDLSSAWHAAMAGLLRLLRAEGYRFITPTPLTHSRVLARPRGRPDALKDAFGWSRPFTAGDLPHRLLACLEAAAMLDRDGDRLRSRVRVSSVDDDLFLHSAYPTSEADAVFFGPDTYRFCRFIREAIEEMAAPPVRILDVGCGTGAGAVAAARALRGRRLSPQWVLSDINPRALRFAACNLDAASVPANLALGDGLQAVAGDFDLIVANPPYMADAQHRQYRDGGEGHGRALSVRLAREALPRLAPGGRLALYTGVAMVDGVDPFIAELLQDLESGPYAWRYEEIDPDVFGEELESEAYQDVDRIAAVGLVATRTGGAR
ncbi:MULTISPECIES: methyltransferase [Ramlibacter]|uniref:Methyltransferase n=1 Tax=Ramlibacter aquaticus TaxID=2780094 RepID=A0ABR9S9R4_9BURK|nr:MULTISPECIES: methyltransferase [Ramlibacter]MBE7939087.1 methyltransferase [Ramlibacter aquaticus]